MKQKTSNDVRKFTPIRLQIFGIIIKIAFDGEVMENAQFSFIQRHIYQ